jgi:uncharacterized protein (TIGR00251 family)
MDASLMEIEVRAHPRASRERVAWDGDRLDVWVTAPAIEGAANHSLVRAVADALRVRRSAVTLLSGERGRRKRLRVEGLALESLEALRKRA